MRIALWAAALTVLLSPVLAAEDKERGVGDVVYVPTPQVVVEEMLRLGKVGPGDFIIDLGSGDGRMVITAAKSFGARGFGVDLSEDLLAEADRNAKKEGVSDRAQFFRQNLFETDLSRATVISSYLLPEMNLKLRPKILNLKPGTRVVAHDYSMGEWYHDQTETLAVPEKVVGNPGISYIYLWIVPAKIGGHWQSQVKSGSQPVNWDFDFTQTFQMFNAVAKSGSQTVALPGQKLEADKISLAFVTKPGDLSTRHEFTGTVRGDVIEGTFRLAGGPPTPWVAKLVKPAETAKPAGVSR
jgi:hypothetical protein